MKKINKFSILENIDLKGARVTYNEFNINPGLKFEDQEFSFQEDLLQIEYGNIYIIDIGFYPSLDPKGYFKIVAIKEFDWDNPIFKKTCKDVFTLKNYLQQAIDFVHNFEDKKLKKKIKKFRGEIFKRIDIKSGKVVPIDLFLEPISKPKNTFIKIIYHNTYAIEISWQYIVNYNDKFADAFKIKVVDCKSNGVVVQKEYEESLEEIFDDLNNIIKGADLANKEIPKNNLKEHITQTINLKEGYIIKDNFNINPKISFKDQIWLLKSRLISIRINDINEDNIKDSKIYNVSINWTKEYDPSGSFEVTAYKIFFENEAFYRKETKDINTLKEYLQEAINITSDLVKNKQ